MPSSASSRRALSRRSAWIRFVSPRLFELPVIGQYVRSERYSKRAASLFSPALLSPERRPQGPPRPLPTDPSGEPTFRRSVPNSMTPSRLAAPHGPFPSTVGVRDVERVVCVWSSQAPFSLHATFWSCSVFTALPTIASRRPSRHGSETTSQIPYSGGLWRAAATSPPSKPPPERSLRWFAYGLQNRLRSPSDEAGDVR